MSEGGALGSAGQADPGVGVPKPIAIARESIFDLAGHARISESGPFDPSNSPWYQRAIFIVGPPRSGTTWLHQMLSAHPDVATGGEMHAFCEGLDRLFENFDNPDPYMGLSTWVNRRQLIALMRDFVDGVFTAGAQHNRANARFVLDKSPNHVQSASRLAEVYPDGVFLNIIRDPRDAISSAHHLWSSWEESFRNWSTAAKTWRANVDNTREHLAGLRYYEVRYEDLLARPADHLAEMLDLIGVDYDLGFVREAVEFARAPINVSPSDQRVSARKWVDLDPMAERTIIAEAGLLAVELGYVSPEERAAILARRSLRDSVGRGRSALRSAPRRAYRLARRAVILRPRPTGQRRGDVITTSSRLAAAVIAGEDSIASGLLASDAYLELPNHARVAGRTEVLRLLHLLLDSTSASAVMADATAAALEIVPSQGSRRSLSCFVRGEVVSHIRVNDPGDIPLSTSLGSV
ncbi:MAG TPA: sulfotransferase [Mycobacteriales bacterium]|nr:sulfotransferase [Mycobacteriales bacterium]